MLPIREQLGSPEYTRALPPASSLSPQLQLTRYDSPALHSTVPYGGNPNAVLARSLMEKDPASPSNRLAPLLPCPGKKKKSQDADMLRNVRKLCSSSLDKNIKKFTDMTPEERRDLQVHQLMKTQSKKACALERVQFEERVQRLETTQRKLRMEHAESIRVQSKLEDRLCQSEHEHSECLAQLQKVRKRNMQLLSQKEGYDGKGSSGGDEDVDSSTMKKVRAELKLQFEEQLAAEVAQAQEKTVKVREEVKRLKHELKHAEDVSPKEGELKEQVSELNKELASVNTEKKSVEAAKSQVEEQLKKATEQQQSQRRKTVEISKMNAEMKEQIKRQENDQGKALKDTVGNIQEENKFYKKKLVEMADKLGEAEHVLEFRSLTLEESAILSKDIELRSIRWQLSEAQRARDAAAAALGRSRTESQQQEERHRQQEHFLESEIEMLNAKVKEMSRLRTDMKQLKRELESTKLAEHHTTVQAEMTVKDRDLALHRSEELEQRIELQEEEIDQQHLDLSQKAESINLRKKQTSQLQSHLDEQKSVNNGLNNSVLQLSAEKQALEETLDLYKERLAAEQGDREVALFSSDILKSEMAGLRQQLAVMQAKLQQVHWPVGGGPGIAPASPVAYAPIEAAAASPPAAAASPPAAAPVTGYVTPRSNLVGAYEEFKRAETPQQSVEARQKVLEAREAVSFQKNGHRPSVGSSRGNDRGSLGNEDSLAAEPSVTVTASSSAAIVQENFEEPVAEEAAAPVAEEAAPVAEEAAPVAEEALLPPPAVEHLAADADEIPDTDADEIPDTDDEIPDTDEEEEAQAA